MRTSSVERTLFGSSWRALNLKPRGELNHGGRALNLTGDPVLRAQVLPGILQWIEQGAYDTERVGASGCP